jgi:hypothetical protein
VGNWVAARIAELDGKALIPIVVACLSMAGTWCGHIRQGEQHDTNNSQFISTLAIIGSHQLQIDSLKAVRDEVRVLKRQLVRLHVIRGRGVKIVAWPDTIVYTAPRREPGLLHALRNLWPWHG